MTLNKASVVVGQICAPYGVKGWMHVRSFTVPQNNLSKFPAWRIYRQDEQHSTVVKVEQLKAYNDHFVAKLVAVADRNAAAKFTNWNIAIARELLPPLNKGEYYWADLIGMTVYTTDDVKLGEVTDFLATGANDVLIVTGDKEYLIPYVLGTYILHISLEDKKIQVDWDVEF